MSVLDRPIRGRARPGGRARAPALGAPKAGPSRAKAAGRARPLAGTTSKALVVAALAVAGIAAAIPLVQDSDATTRGYELRDLERTRDTWRARAHALESEVAALASTERVQREATQRLGMAPPGQTIFLETNVGGPSANRAPLRYVAERTAGADRADSATSRSLWERVLRALTP